MKIPPVAVGFVTAALMWLLAWATPAFGFFLGARNFITGSFAILGAVISALGVISFRRARTTVNPIKPEAASSLVVSGVYKFTRNPMYLGFALILVAWAVFLSNTLTFLLIAVFILYMRRFQIEPEERALASLFPQDFTTYKSRVRRWL